MFNIRGKGLPCFQYSGCLGMSAIRIGALFQRERKPQEYSAESLTLNPTPVSLDPQPRTLDFLIYWLYVTCWLSHGLVVPGISQGFHYGSVSVIMSSWRNDKCVHDGC